MRLAPNRRLAYLCLQATTQGQASHAHVHEIIDGMREDGWTVDLYEPSYAGKAAPGALARLLEFWRVQQRLRRRLGDYDAVYVRAHAFAYPLARAASRRHVPIIQEVNGSYEDLFTAWPTARWARGPLTAAMTWQYKRATALIGVTPGLSRWLNEQTGRSDTATVPNGANTEVFRPERDVDEARRPRDDYAVFFGALAAWQGVPLILDAVRLPEWPPEVHLTVIGDGALRAEVERAAQLDDRVRYLGRLPYRELGRIVAGAICSLVVMDEPLRTGSLGMSPLKYYESMAAGVPVIVAEAPDIGDEVRRLGTGIVVPPSDPAAIALAVARLASDPEARRAMGDRGRDAAEELHSWRTRAGETMRIIEKAIEDSRETETSSARTST